MPLETPGAGWIRSVPYQLDCPNVCTRAFGAGTTVILTAHPTSGYTFESWTGACAGQGNPCTFVVTSSTTDITARFSGQYVPQTAPGNGGDSGGSNDSGDSGGSGGSKGSGGSEGPGGTPRRRVLPGRRPRLDLLRGAEWSRSAPRSVDGPRCDSQRVRVTEIAPGLWRWTGLHQEWTPAEGGPDGWEQEVGCVYYEAPEAVVLIDPLVPPEDRDRFHAALDRDVARVGRPARILLTTESHRRSAGELANRHGATIGEPPESVETAAAAWDEQVFWIPEHRALVFGDVVLGHEGGLRVPRAWIGDRFDAVVEELRPLLDLPVERVLVGHGEPVLESGHEALAAALPG